MDAKVIRDKAATSVALAEQMPMPDGSQVTMLTMHGKASLIGPAYWVDKLYYAYRHSFRSGHPETFKQALEDACQSQIGRTSMVAVTKRLDLAN